MMQILSKIVVLICLFFVLVLGFLLVTNNPQVVTISLLGFQASLNLGVLMTLIFSAGVLLGLVALLIVIAATKMKLAMKEKELVRLRGS
ncbi:MAG TPA: lipopolysaccharide assembly protein LapA domain-containing protein [Pseudomonadales bacterium]